MADIPALPRVVDALSTIIWPSMRSNKVAPGVGGRDGSLDLNGGFDEMDSDDEECRKERMRMHRQLLEELDEEVGESEWTPWESGSSSETMAAVSEMRMSPAEMEKV
jgi:hypothetical protein